MGTDKKSRHPDDYLALTPDELQTYFKRAQEIKKSFDFRDVDKQLIQLRQQMIDERNGNVNSNKKIGMVFPAKTLSLPGIIPFLPDRTSAISNWIAKSSVFAPRQKGRAKLDTGSSYIELSSPRGVKILYNGPFLSMKDQSLYLHLVKKASGFAPNEFIYITRAQLLKEIGHKDFGVKAYNWLEEAFDRLIQANIKIVLSNYKLDDESNRLLDGAQEHDDNELGEGGKKRITFLVRLIGEFAHDHDKDDYYFTMPKASLALFSQNLYGFNSLTQRAALRHGKQAELAAWMQSYICADERGEHRPVFIETIHKLSGSKGRIDIFSKRLVEAMDNCKVAGIITSWESSLNRDGKAMITWVRP